MQTILELVGRNEQPGGIIMVLAIIGAILLYMLVACVFSSLGYAWNRWLRHLNIISRGWPPEHLDADGDFKKPSDDEE